MSKTPVTADMVESGSPLVGMTLLDGDDRLVVRHVDDEATVSKTVRVPASLVDKADVLGNPGGFSGVVRDALVAYLNVDQNEIDKALSVIQRAVGSNRAA